MLFIAQAFDFAINLLRRGHAAAGRIHFQDDGFDGIVVPELLKLRHDDTGIQDHAFHVHNSNLVAKGVERGLFSACMHGEIHQREYRQHEEKKYPSANHNPKHSAGTTILSHTVKLV